MNINIPEGAKYILDRLQSEGFEGYVVGGCVRDSLLGVVPEDWDITTNALPLQVKELFGRTIDTGLKHGTVTVMRGSKGYEITTYRTDGDYSDGRHPDKVTFVPNLEEDLKRRDFTINAMAYNDSAGLVDLFGGREDLERGIIRCVGSPYDRFSEDALRMLRAVRFAARLGFVLDGEVTEAIKKLSGTLSKVSAERITAELVKLLTSDDPEMIRIAYETGLTKVFFPEFDVAMETPQNHPHHCYSVGDHLIESLRFSGNDRIVRLAMLLHDIAKPDTRTTDENGIDHFHGHESLSAKKAEIILRRWKLDNDTIRRVCRLIKLHDYGNGEKVTMRMIRRAVSETGEDFPLLLDVKRADILAQSEYKRDEKLAAVDAFAAGYEEIVKAGDCCFLSDLKIGGEDLRAAGIKPGPLMGRILSHLLDLVIEDPGFNDREKLLPEAMRFAESEGEA